VRADTRLTSFLAALGAVAVGAAVQIADGYGRPAAFVWLTVAVAAVLLAVVLPSHRTLEAVLGRVLPPVLVVALVGQLWAMLQRTPARPFDAVPSWRPTFLLAAVVVVVAACGIAMGRGLVRHLAILALLATHLALGIWTIRVQPQPWPMIDVYMFQRDSVAALLAGVNPYAITFPNPYTNGVYYGPGMVVDGRLTFGFVYPPLSVFLSVLGQWAGGDVRYAQLGAMTLAAAFMAYTRRGRLGGLAAALFLFTPRNLFVLEQSWTEPFVVLFLAATVWCAARHPRVAPYVLGLFLAVKQYAVLALPLALLITRPPMSLAGLRRTVVPAVAVAAVVTLPLALREPTGFLRAVVELQFYQPFRPEALSYLGLLAGPDLQPPFGTGVAFAVAAAVTGLALWRAARTPAGFALGVSAVFLAFFVLNKQAFANYYFFVIGALCVAVAATQQPAASRPAAEPWATGRRAEDGTTTAAPEPKPDPEPEPPDPDDSVSAARPAP
jgi:hypothetical protein